MPHVTGAGECQKRGMGVTLSSFSPLPFPLATERSDSLYRENNKAFASLGSETLLRFVAPVALSIFFSSSREGEVRHAELNLGRTLLVKD